MSALPTILERDPIDAEPTEPRVQRPTLATLRTRLHATEALYTALMHRHLRARSQTSLAELIRCRGHVLEAKTALAKAVQS